MLAKQLGFKKVYILNDKEAYGLGVATNFRNAAKKLGIKVAGLHGVERQGVELRGAGEEDQADGRRRRLPRRPHLRERRQADQGPAQRPRRRREAHRAGRLQRLRRRNGAAAAEGVYVSVAGQPNENLSATGQDVRRRLRRDADRQARSTRTPRTRRRRPRSLLAAIERSDGTRAASRISCSRRTSRTGFSARSRSTRTATRTEPGHDLRSRAAKQTTFKVDHAAARTWSSKA